MNGSLRAVSKTKIIYMEMFWLLLLFLFFFFLFIIIIINYKVCVI